MPALAEPSRRFSVHVRHASHHSRILEEATFEAAAVAYVEHFHSPIGTQNEVRIVVRDVENGHEHCFQIDLEGGAPAACE